MNTYLDALHAPEGVDRELMLLSSFERAIARKRDSPFTPATELVFEEMQKSLDESLGHLIGNHVPDHRRSAEERVRLFLNEAAIGSVLGQSEPVSRDVVEAMREVKLDTAPRSQPSSITPRPFATSRIGARIGWMAGRLSPLGANRWIVWGIVLLLVFFLVYFSLVR